MALPSLIIWDWNGTLLDDRDVCIRCLNGVLAQFGYPQRYETESYREIFGFPIIDYYRRAGFDFERDPYPVLAEAYMAKYLPAAESCGLTAGARETLERYAALGVPQVILSASDSDTLQKQVNARDAAGFFTELLGLGDIYAYSKAERGRLWMAGSGIDPSRAVMVGDSRHDAETAAAMGTKCVLLACGHESVAHLQSTGCPVAQTLAELPAVLDALF